MNNYLKKVVPALSMLLTAVLSLSGVTFAWFTQNNRVSVTNIDVNVDNSKGGLAIASTLTGSYGNTFALADDAVKYYPVSTDCTLTASDTDAKDYLSFYRATLSEESSALINKTEAVTDGFKSFDIYFETLDSVDKPVYLDYEHQYDLFDVASDSQVPVGAKSIRIAFIYQGSKASTDSLSWTNNETDSIVVVEPYSTSHLSPTAGTSKESYYGISSTFQADPDGDPIVPEVAIKPSTVPDWMTAVSTIDFIECNGFGCTTKDTFKYTSGESQVDLTPIFTLHQGYNKVTVVVWYEGQDIDCTNQIAGTITTICLQFITPELTSDD